MVLLLYFERAAGKTGMTDRERCEEIRACKDGLQISKCNRPNVEKATTNDRVYLSNFKIKNDSHILAYMDMRRQRSKKTDYTMLSYSH